MEGAALESQAASLVLVATGFCVVAESPITIRNCGDMVLIDSQARPLRLLPRSSCVRSQCT